MTLGSLNAKGVPLDEECSTILLPLRFYWTSLLPSLSLKEIN